MTARLGNAMPFVAILVLSASQLVAGQGGGAGRSENGRPERDSMTPARVLALMRDAQAELTSLVAAIEQVKSYPQLGIEDPPERGLFYLLSDDAGGRGPQVRLEMREPETRVLTIQDGGYVLYQPRINQAVFGRLTAGGKTSMFTGILIGSSDSIVGLDRDYVVEVDDDGTEDDDAHRLRFTARPGAAVLCRRIDLWVDRASLLPIRQSCHEANESVLTFVLSDISTGVPIGEEMFEIELPAGVEKIES